VRWERQDSLIELHEEHGRLLLLLPIILVLVVFDGAAASLSDAFSPPLSDFKNYYYSDVCTGDGRPVEDPFLLLANATLNYTMNSTSQIINSMAGEDNNKVSSLVTTCRRDSSLLFLLLMLGTVWVAITLYNFNKT
jgi:sodium borate transporter 11